MSKKLHIFLIFFLLGLIFMPSEVFACGTKKANKVKTCDLPSSCKKQLSETSNKTKEIGSNCCDQPAENKSQSNNEKHNCDGNCNHNSCSCAALSFSINLPQNVDLKLNTIILIKEKNIFSYDETNLPAGFHFIWLPPVIS